MTTITIDRAVVEQALEFVTSERWGTTPYMDVCVYEDAARLREALRAALAQQDEPQDAELSAALGWPGGISELVLDRKTLLRQVADIRAALAQQAEPVQEPYAWMAVGGTVWRHKSSQDDVPLYTTPPQRKPLTEEEVEHIGMTHQSLRQVVRAAEKAVWEKNHG